MPRITRMIIPDQESVYHVQIGNKGNFLSLDFGLKAFVSRKYIHFKDLFHSKLEKKPKPIKGK